MQNLSYIGTPHLKTTVHLAWNYPNASQTFLCNTKWSNNKRDLRVLVLGRDRIETHCCQRIDETIGKVYLIRGKNAKQKSHIRGWGGRRTVRLSIEGSRHEIPSFQWPSTWKHNAPLASRLVYIVYIHALCDSISRELVAPFVFYLTRLMRVWYKSNTLRTLHATSDPSERSEIHIIPTWLWEKSAVNERARLNLAPD